MPKVKSKNMGLETVKLDPAGSVRLLEEKVRQKHRSRLVLGQREEEERRLEHLVLGGQDDFIHKLVSTQPLKLSTAASDSSDDEEAADEKHQVEKQPVWEDEDDADNANELVDMKHQYRREFVRHVDEKTLPRAKLQQRLKSEFEKAMGGVPDWADLSRIKKKRQAKHDSDDEQEEDDGEDDLLTRTGNYLTSSESLPKGILRMKNCIAANQQRTSDGRLTSVQFHPSAAVILTAGLDRSLSLFQVDGHTNPKIQSVFLDRFPVYRARFSADGEKVIATGIRSKPFYVYDMIAGKITPILAIRGLEEKCIKRFELSPDGRFMMVLGTSGVQHLISLKANELVGSMKVNGQANAATFSADGKNVYTTTDEGQVYVWDVDSRRCVNRFTDDGCVNGSSIAASPDGRYLACGSVSGVVNLYTCDECHSKPNPAPLKALMNLVTPATSLAFNSTSEILAMASNAANEAARLVHVPSQSVFSNFPVFRRKTIYLAQTMAFSPHSGFLSIANNKGLALLYRLKHYSDF
ncbi:U3 small nucleolar RNA-associated protein 18 homolog [Lampetra fluviatilis]